jgi:mono/diheme cytochrome c family protein
MKITVALFASAALLLGPMAWAEDTKSFSEGRALYMRHCVGCHGNLGIDENGSPVSSRGGRAPAVSRPDLTLIAARDGSFDPVRVANHINGRQNGQNPNRTMPIWSDHLNREWPTGDGMAALKINWLTTYLESVQQGNTTTRR